jgi:hypothetical protein
LIVGTAELIRAGALGVGAEEVLLDRAVLLGFHRAIGLFVTRNKNAAIRILTIDLLIPVIVQTILAPLDRVLAKVDAVTNGITA